MILCIYSYCSASIFLKSMWPGEVALIHIQAYTLNEWYNGAINYMDVR